MPEQRINRLNITCLEVKDNSEQNRGGKFISILCNSKSDSDRPFPGTGPCIMLPSGNNFTVRNCEETDNNDYIVTIKGLHRKDIKRGNIIVPASYAVKSGRDAFILAPSGGRTLEKGNYYIEGGVHDDYNCRNNRPSASISFYGRVGVVKFFWPFPLVIGAKYFISHENNRDLRIPVTLIFPGSLGKKEGFELSSRILKFGGRPSLQALYSIILRIKHYVQLPVYMESEEFDGSVECGSFRVMSREYERIRGAVIKRSSTVGGALEKELPDQINGDNDLINEVITVLCKERVIKRSESFLINISNDTRKSLSPIAKKLLEDLKDEKEGITLSNISNPLFSETYKALGRMELVQILSGEIIISDKRYEELKFETLKSLKIGDRFSFNEIKESLQLSRRVLIPLLEEMDKEGFFERDGEERFVLKID